MSIKSLTPYLMFDGTAAKAIALYERALGAHAEGVMRFSDAPPDAGHTPDPKAADRVLHALLRIGGGAVMLSDCPPGMSVPNDTNTQVCVEFSEQDEMVERFDALAAGGHVTMPLQDTFWGAHFGMLTDPFGIQWMFSCELKKG